MSPKTHSERVVGPAVRLFLTALLALTAGCQTAPAPPAPPVPQRQHVQADTLRALGFIEDQGNWMLSLSVRILFEVDRDTLTPQMKERIATMAADLKRAGIRRVRIEGHTDNVGSRTYNLELSRRRAEAVAREFALNGYPDDAIVRRGWGWNFPVATNETPDGRALNRRVAIVVAAEDLPRD